MAIPRVLDVLEALEIAGSDPAAIPLLRSLESDLARHFLTNLAIYSALGGLAIWGCRSNRKLTLSLIGVGIIALIILGASQTGMFEQAGSTTGSTSRVESPATLAPAPTRVRTPTAKPSGISAGGSDFFDDSSSAPLAPIVNYSCSCPQLSVNALNSAPQDATACFSGLWTGGACGKRASWLVQAGVFGATGCGMDFEGFTGSLIEVSEQDCPGCFGSSVAESQGSIRQDTYIDVTGWVTGYRELATGHRTDNGLVVTSVQACSIVP